MKIKRKRVVSNKEKLYRKFWFIKQKYGLTKEDYYSILNRQHNRCLGCQKVFNEENLQDIHIDHDHKTNRVRGILCGYCNKGLGFLLENKGTLYRLAAYLDRDPNKHMIYVIGSLRNPNITAVAKKLREAGYDAFDNWISVGPNADDHWQEYETEKGLTYKEALKGRSAQHVFNYDRAYLDLCDSALMVMPGGKSAHLELGYIKGQGKPAGILLDKDPERYDVMPNFANDVYKTVDEFIEMLKNES